MITYDTARPFLASYLIIRRDSKILFELRVGKRWMSGFYGIPAGKVEKDETFSNTMIREAKEEIGITISLQDLRYRLTCHRYDKEDQASWVDVVFETSNWKGEIVNAEPKKHSKLVWLDPDDLPNNVIPSVKFMLDQIKAGKTYCEYGWQ